MLAPDDTLKGLVAIVGSGGISGIIIAITSYLDAARSGTREDGSTGAAVIAGLSTDMHSKAQADHLAAIAYALAKAVAIMEIKAEKELASDVSFHDRLENKLDRILIDIVRASPPKA